MRSGVNGAYLLTVDPLSWKRSCMWRFDARAHTIFKKVANWTSADSLDRNSFGRSISHNALNAGRVICRTSSMRRSLDDRSSRMYSSALNGEVWNASLSYEGRLKVTIQADAANISRIFSILTSNKSARRAATSCCTAYFSSSLPISFLRFFTVDALRADTSELERCVFNVYSLNRLYLKHRGYDRA